jgi:protein arginine phosphatase
LLFADFKYNSVVMGAPVVQILQAADYANQIRRAAQLLTDGKLVALPTETVYGAAALISNPVGRERLRAFRQGSPSRPFVPHLTQPEQAGDFLTALSETAKRMMSKLWPGPVGLQFDVEPARRRVVAARMNAAESDLYEGSSITLRCPDHRVFADVAVAAGGTIAAAFAGAPGEFDPSLLSAELDGKVDLILDAGPPRFSQPSTLVKFDRDGYHVVRPGVYDERTIRRLMKTTILYVCSGNTCRSPMAEAITRRLLADRLGVDASELEKSGYEVLSAGAMAMPGAKATPVAADVIRALGGDLSRHRSRPLSVELINQADLIFTMSRNHSRAVIAMVPSAESKVQTLDARTDIEDPIGGDAELYRALARQLRVLIEMRLREKALP